MDITDEYLIKLYNDIWKDRTISQPVGRHYEDKILRVEARSLTFDECSAVSNAAKTRIVIPQNSGMGFGISVTLYSPPSYPGVPPSKLICVTNKHLGESCTFEQGWLAFQPMFDNERNKQWLNFYGFGEIKSKSFYDY